MTHVLGAIALTLALVTPVLAAEPVSQTFSGSLDKVWSITEAVLKQLGWDIERSDRAIGWITTESRRVEGEDWGVYEKGTRHRLVVKIKATAPTRTTVSVERSVFKRERILWIDKDEPLTVADQTVERALLAEIGKAL
jgi:hypothetical protein